jgi:hypothetical protein
MIDLNTVNEIYLYTGITDFRYGMAHARRYFYDVIKGLNPKEAKQSKARLVVE